MHYVIDKLCRFRSDVHSLPSSQIAIFGERNCKFRTKRALTSLFPSELVYRSQGLWLLTLSYYKLETTANSAQQNGISNYYLAAEIGIRNHFIMVQYSEGFKYLLKLESKK